METSMKCAAMLSLCGVLLGTAVSQPAKAQSQQSSQPSVAEAARRARAQKEKESPAKPAKVITNDDLKPAPEVANGAVQPATAGASQTAPTTAAQASPTTPKTKENGEDVSKEREAKEKELADLKRQLASAQSDLDLYQRQFSLQRDTYYSDPDYAHDTDGKAKLDALQQQINDKAQSVDELKLKVSALQELLGVDAQKEAPAGP